MNPKVLMVSAVFSVLILSAKAADPIMFNEISDLVRSGRLPQFIVGDVGRRKLLLPLSPQEEAALLSAGAKPAFVEALRAPSLLAAPEVVTAAKARQQAQALAAAKNAPVTTLQLTDALRPGPLPSRFQRHAGPGLRAP
jgi:hypothetical protein